MSVGQHPAAQVGPTSASTAVSRSIATQFGNGRLVGLLQAKLALSPAGPGVVQRHKAVDARLPADRAEALRFAVESKTAIDAALAHLPSATDQRSRNVPSFIAQQRLTFAALTPRHDSAAEGGSIRFFVGTDYRASVVLVEDATHHIDNSRHSVRIRARRTDDVDTLLTGPEIEQRIVAAVSEVAHLSAAQSGAPDLFERYRAQFNAEWSVAGAAGGSSWFQPSLDSKGPRTFKSRIIFERIYNADAAIRNAYDGNRGGVRERIDTYTTPESFNPLVSPRLQKLREVFFHASAPLSNAAFARFRPLLAAAAANLDGADREAVDFSEDWQRLINAYATTDEQRADLRTIIRTPPTAPAPPITPAPAPAGPRQTVTPQTTFVDGVTIDGPKAPIKASGRRAAVTLTPRSSVPNPGVNIDARFTITPAGRVAGNGISPDLKWASGTQTGPSFATEIFNSSTVEMTAHLDLVNEPGGLAPAAPIPDLKFTVQDDRQAHFVDNWFVGLGHRVGTARSLFDPANPPRYFGGAQIFWILSSLRDRSTNPGLALFLRARMKRDGVVISAPQTLEPFAPDSGDSLPIQMSTMAPEPTPPTGDPLTFEVDLLAADRSTVLRTETIPIKVLPEETYTKAQAIAQAIADDAYLHDQSPTGLLTKMFAKGGAAAVAAAAIVAPDEPKLHVMPLSRRHDSRKYVTAINQGRPNPEQIGYFVGTTYEDTPPDASHSFAESPAAGMQLPEGFGPRAVTVNVTNEVGATPPVRRSDERLMQIIVHESVHALDERPDADSLIERYKTEFRAYWMDGALGPPEQGTCPLPATPFTTPCAPKGCMDTEYRPELPPPGPKSCRARAIFEHMYGVSTYGFVKPAYDNNTHGFRDAVDRYVIPDGINLILSRRLESLRELIEGYSGRGFATFRKHVQGFVGTGTAPAVGALSAEEWNEVKRTRAWRDLIDRKIGDLTHRGEIKEDLWIPE